MKNGIIDCIERLETTVLDLENGDSDAEAVRAALSDLGLTHLKLPSAQVTALLDMLADGITPVNDSVVTACLGICDSYKKLLYTLAGVVDDHNERIRNRTEQLRTAKDEAAEDHDVDASADEQTRKDGEAECRLMEAELAEPQAGSGAKSSEDAAATDSALGSVACNPSGNGSKQSKSAISSIRVSTSKLDSLIDHVGKLMVMHAVISQGEAQSSGVVSGLKEMDTVIDRIKTEVERIRLVPLKQIFVPIHRLVKNLTGKVDKKIEFVVEGEDLELDKTIVEYLNEPLVHLLRNAVDHGLETPEKRLAAGKSETGTLTLRAERRGETAYLQVRDDGRGLDPDKILSKALEKGLADPGKAYGKDDILKFIMMPGFSTAEKVTDISGRGVGMDAVVETVRDTLMGEITVDSEVGRGACFTLAIPLSRSVNEGIVDALVTRQGEDTFIIPSRNVCEVYAVKSTDIADLRDGREVIDVRGELCSLIRLGDFLRIEQGANDDPHGEAEAVVVRVGDRKAAILVNEVLRQQQVVVTNFTVPLSEMYDIPILGFGMMGESDALVLDVEDMVNQYAETAR